MSSAIHYFKAAVRWPVELIDSVRARGAHLAALATRENFIELLRRISQAVGQLFRLMGMAAAAPFFFIEFAVKSWYRLPDEYRIGTEEAPATSHDVEEELERLKHPSRKIERLEIFTEEELSATSIGAIFDLQPDILQVNREVELETVAHYFIKEGGHYALRRKIPRVVLPDDPIAATDEVNRLARMHERVVAIYYCFLRDRESEMKTLEKAIAQLKPEALFPISSTQGLLPMLLLQ